MGREEQKEKGDKTKKKGECSEKKEVEDADEHHEVEGQENEEETTIGHVGETEAEEEDVQDEDGKIDLERSERQEEENEEGEDYEEEEEEDGEEAVAQINSESQSDQSFLLRRGRELFQEGSVGAALETYSFGVKMHPKHGESIDRSKKIFCSLHFFSPLAVPFYNNRSACRLKVGDLVCMDFAILQKIKSSYQSKLALSLSTVASPTPPLPWTSSGARLEAPQETPTPTPTCCASSAPRRCPAAARRWRSSDWRGRRWESSKRRWRNNQVSLDPTIFK